MYKLLKSKIVINTLWISIGQVVELLIALVFGIFVYRYLSVQDFGKMDYAISMMNVLLPLATLSSSGILMKKIVEDRERENIYIGTMLFFRVCSGLLSAGLLMLLISFTQKNNLLMLTLAGIQSISLIFNIYELYLCWFNSKLEANKYVIFRIVTCILVCVYKFIILYLGKDVRWFCFSNVLDSIIISFFCAFYYKTKTKTKLKVDFQIGIEIVKTSSFYIISGICTVLLVSVNKFFIGFYLGEIDLGIYSNATYIGFLWGFVLNAIIESMRASIVNAKKESSEKYKTKIHQLYSLVFWCGIIASVGITLVSPYILVILYGEKYAAGGIILGITCWMVVFQHIAKTRTVWLISENKNQYDLIFSFLGIVINVILCVCLIPLWGIKGAATVTVATQVIIAIFLPFLFKQTRESCYDLIKGILYNWFKRDEGLE